MTMIPTSPFESASFSTQTDLSDSLFHTAKLSSGLIILGNSKGGPVEGIIQEKVKASATDERTVQVAISGICRAECGASVSEGDYLIDDGSGRLIPDDGANQFVVARALADGDAGDYISVRLILSPTLTA
jgi:hypothetical protein